MLQIDQATKRQDYYASSIDPGTSAPSISPSGVSTDPAIRGEGSSCCSVSFSDKTPPPIAQETSSRLADGELASTASSAASVDKAAGTINRRPTISSPHPSGLPRRLRRGGGGVSLEWQLVPADQQPVPEERDPSAAAYPKPKSLEAYSTDAVALSKDPRGRSAGALGDWLNFKQTAEQKVNQAVLRAVRARVQLDPKKAYKRLLAQAMKDDTASRAAVLQPVAAGSGGDSVLLVDPRCPSSPPIAAATATNIGTPKVAVFEDGRQYWHYQQSLPGGSFYAWAVPAFDQDGRPIPKDDALRKGPPEHEPDVVFLRQQLPPSDVAAATASLGYVFSPEAKAEALKQAALDKAAGQDEKLLKELAAREALLADYQHCRSLPPPLGSLPAFSFPTAPSGAPQDAMRNIEQVFHVGSWTEQGHKDISLTAATRDQPALRHWMATNRRMFAIAADRLREHLPMAYQLMMQVVGRIPPHMRLDVFCTAGLNNGSSTLHLDQHDLPQGRCCVLPFGQYQGGGLYMPQIGLAINLQPGDMVFFRSDVCLLSFFFFALLPLPPVEGHLHRRIRNMAGHDRGRWGRRCSQPEGEELAASGRRAVLFGQEPNARAFTYGRRGPLAAKCPAPSAERCGEAP